MYSQNVQGLKIEMKEEYLVRIIKTRKLVAFTVQERHLTGDYVKIIGEKKYYMIHHRPEEQPRCKKSKMEMASIHSKQMPTYLF